MNKDQVKGTAKEIKGSVKEAIGEATGNPGTELKGKIEKNVGTAQKKLGDTKEALDKASKRP